MSERSVRQYCQEGRVAGAIQKDRQWLIHHDATKPLRKKRNNGKNNNLLKRLQEEKDSQHRGGIYHKVQIEFTYNSNHIEGSKLSHDQTRYIFETNTIGLKGKSANVDDIIETVNHFKCIDYIIDRVNFQLSESLIKQLHYLLKFNTSDSQKS